MVRPHRSSTYEPPRPAWPSIDTQYRCGNNSAATCLGFGPLRSCNPSHRPRPAAVALQDAAAAAAVLNSPGASAATLEDRSSRLAYDHYYREQRRNGMGGQATRLLVSPSHRLVLCPIEKNALSQWIDLFFELTGPRASRNFISWVKASRNRGLPSFEGVPLGMRAAVLACDSWTKVVVVRDPLERLLSAYLDKCVHAPQRPHAKHCVGFADKVPTFAQLVDTLFRIYTRGISMRRPYKPHEHFWFHALNLVDVHFAPQQVFCGLGPGSSGYLLGREGMLTRYHHVIRMSSPDFHDDVYRLFDTLGVPANLTRAHLPRVAATAHRTGASQKLQQFFNDSRLTWQALQIFESDYETFQMPRPAWAESLARQFARPLHAFPVPAAGLQPPPWQWRPHPNARTNRYWRNLTRIRD